MNKKCNKSILYSLFPTFFPGVIPGVSLSTTKAVKASPVLALGSDRANRKYLKRVWST